MLNVRKKRSLLIIVLFGLMIFNLLNVPISNAKLPFDCNSTLLAAWQYQQCAQERLNNALVNCKIESNKTCQVMPKKDCEVQGGREVPSCIPVILCVNWAAKKTICSNVGTCSSPTEIAAGQVWEVRSEYYDASTAAQACAAEKADLDKSFVAPPEVCDYNSSLSKFIPNSILKVPYSNCNRDTNIFVVAAVNLASYLLSIVGALALAMFIYGGFLLILSEGSPDKIKKGTTVMLAAVMGLFVVFGAYILVAFVGQGMGLTDTVTDVFKLY